MSDIFWSAFGGGAAAGLFTLLALGFVEWLRRFLDRPLVLVRAMWAYYREPISNNDVRRISVDAVNPHSTPVTLSTFGFGLREKESMLFVIPETVDLPYELKGGKSITELCRVENLFDGLRKGNKTPNDLAFVWYRAQSGKLYKKKLHKNFIKILQEEFDART
jgi:hypothetical protein